MQYEYDVHGRRTAETVLEGDAAGTPRRTVRYTYDSFDRVLEKRILAPDGGELYREAFVYTDLYRDPDAGMRCVDRTQKTVFGAGPDAPDLQTVTDTDPAGRTIKEMTAGICRALYEYDKLDNRTVITDIQGTSVHQSFDWAGRLVKTSCTVQGETRTAGKTYNALGELTVETDYMGTVTRYTRDALGRCLCKSVELGGGDTAQELFAYDAAGRCTGRRVRRRDGWRCSGTQYDARGRIVQELQYRDLACTQRAWVRYEYDGVGRRVQVSTGGDGAHTHTRRYTYDRFGNLLTATDALGRTETREYDPTGRLLAQTGRTGVRTRFCWDALDRLTGKSACVQSPRTGPVQDAETTAYAPDGRVLRRESAHTQGGRTQTLCTRYAYDAAGRLVRQEDPGEVTKRYTYDLCGRKKSFRLFWGHEACALGSFRVQ